MSKGLHFWVHAKRGYYVAECAEYAIVTDGKTLDEVVSNIREAVQLASPDIPQPDRSQLICEI